MYTMRKDWIVYASSENHNILWLNRKNCDRNRNILLKNPEYATLFWHVIDFSAVLCYNSYTLRADRCGMS